MPFDSRARVAFEQVRYAMVDGNLSTESFPVQTSEPVNRERK
jgi:hypothetical protein